VFYYVICSSLCFVQDCDLIVDVKLFCLLILNTDFVQIFFMLFFYDLLLCVKPELIIYMYNLLILFSNSMCFISHFVGKTNVLVSSYIFNNFT